MGDSDDASRDSGRGGGVERRRARDARALGAAAEERRRRWRCGVESCWACADGGSNTEIGEQLEVTRGTVAKWRTRFLDKRLDGLHDETASGLRPRTVSDDDVERVIVKTLEETPANATHWSTRSMAAATGMSQSAVSRIWRAFALKPHLVDEFKLSPDPQFIEKVRDHRRVVSEPARRGGRVVRRREDPSAGTRSDRTDLAAGPRHAPSVAPMTTNATGPPTSTPRSMSRPATSSPT